jgi:glycerol-1-phosphate dehydrogenase [NAD(P)+]
MSALRTVLVPSLIRLKAGALKRLPIYFGREGWSRVLLLKSSGLPPSVEETLTTCNFARTLTVTDNTLAWLDSLSISPDEFDAVCGVGGGKALDVAKMLAYRLDRPYVAAPTSLSNDGFCSHQSSLVRDGRRVSMPARLPVGVVVDLEIALQAPLPLWLSGVGDLVAKRTALRDWKIAFHSNGTAYDDLAALLSDATVFQFMGHPHRDLEGIRLLAQALLLNGVAMEIAGSSRPASGSEHLISHALDKIVVDQPRLHGLQVGLATYWMARVQEQDVSDLEQLFEMTGFWNYWRENPMPKELWVQALAMAPTIKSGFVTVLNQPGAIECATVLLENDRHLRDSLV